MLLTDQMINKITNVRSLTLITLKMLTLLSLELMTYGLSLHRSSHWAMEAMEGKSVHVKYKPTKP